MRISSPIRDTLLEPARILASSYEDGVRQPGICPCVKLQLSLPKFGIAAP